MNRVYGRGLRSFVGEEVGRGGLFFAQSGRFSFLPLQPAVQAGTASMARVSR